MRDLERAFADERARPRQLDPGLVQNARTLARRRRLQRGVAAATATVAVVAGVAVGAGGKAHGRLTITPATATPSPAELTAARTVAGVPASAPTAGPGAGGILPDGLRWQTSGGHVAVDDGTGWQQWSVLDPVAAGRPASALVRVTVTGSATAVALVVEGPGAPGEDVAPLAHRTVTVAQTIDAGRRWTLTDVVLPGVRDNGLLAEPVLAGARVIGVHVPGARDEQDQVLFAVTGSEVEARPLPHPQGQLVASSGVLWDVGVTTLRSTDGGRTWMQVLATAAEAVGPGPDGGLLVHVVDSSHPETGFVDTYSLLSATGARQIAVNPLGPNITLTPFGGTLAGVGTAGNGSTTVLVTMDVGSGSVTTTTATGLAGLSSLQGLRGREGIAASCTATCSIVESHDSGATWTPLDAFTR